MLPSGLMDQLADPKWKERLEACDKFKQVQILKKKNFSEYASVCAHRMGSCLIWRLCLIYLIHSL